MTCRPWSVRFSGEDLTPGPNNMIKSGENIEKEKRSSSRIKLKLATGGKKRKKNKV